MSIPARAIPALTAILLLTGCAGSGDHALSARVLPLGDNLVAEECRAEPVGAATGAREWAIYCGRWSQPSARLLGLEQGAATAAGGSREQLWRAQIDAQMICEPATGGATAAGAAPAALQRCRLRSGGWEQVTVDTTIGERRFLASGTPASLPAIETAIATLAGLRAPAEAGVGALPTSVTTVGRQVTSELYTMGDIDRYDRLMRLASYFNNRESFTEAERYYREALSLRAQAAGDASQAIVEPTLHLALQLSNQGRFGEADALFDEAEALAVGAAVAGESPSTAKFYKVIDQINRGQVDAALAELRRINAELRAQIAQAGRRAVAQEIVIVASDPLYAAQGDLAIGLYLEGRVLARRGDLQAAADAAQAARTAVDQAPIVPRRLAPSVRDLQGEIAARRGDLPAAVAYYREAIAEWTTQFRRSRPEAMTRLALGDALARTGQETVALEEYRTAVAILRDGQETIRYPAAAGYFALLYEQAAAREGERPSLHAEMFDARQLVRTSLAARSIADAAARLAAGDEAIAELIRNFQDATRERDAALQEVNALASQERRATDETARSAIRSERGLLEQRLSELDTRAAQLEQGVQAAYAPFNQLLDTPVTTSAVLAVLQPDELAIDIVVGAEASWLFLLRPSGVEVVRSGMGLARVDQLVRRIRASLDVTGGSLPFFDVEASHALYDGLFAGIGDELARQPQVTLALSGPLASLPLDILAVKVSGVRAGSFDYSGVEWMLQKAVLLTVPSARSLVDLRKVAKAAPAPVAFLGFGDFVPGQFDAAARRSNPCAAELAAIGGLAPLPDTAGEVRAVANALGAGPGSVILGDRFTEQTIEGLPLDQYRVLYFATHALLPGELDCLAEPALIVSPDPTGGQASPTPGFLEASRIADLKLAADLVVLSACNTAGPGTDLGGESLSGLARAFFYAGSRALIVSHWSIPSEETARVMTDTFQRHGAGDLATDRVAGALRAAKLAMLDAGRRAVGNAGAATGNERYWTHPYFWGALEVVGSSDGRAGS